MCLIALSVGQHPDYPLILAANRDEFHARPTKEAHWWPDKPDVVGGRDLQAGGTWLALHRDGRFATVTNYRDAMPSKPGHRSRGHLVTGFLDGKLSPEDYLATIDEDRYAGSEKRIVGRDRGIDCAADEEHALATTNRRARRGEGILDRVEDHPGALGSPLRRDQLR